MKGKIKFTDLHITESGSQTLLIAEVHNESREVFKKILAEVKQKTGKLFVMNIAEYRARRSLDANAYAWLLLDKLAKKLNSTKELIYLEIIKKVGAFEIIPIKEEAVDEWARKWNAKGLGWVSEIIGESKFRGYVNTINYFGSSVYNTKEMYELINEIVFLCKENDIETMTPDELAKLKGLIEE